MLHRKLDDLRNEFIFFLFGDGVSPEKNDGNCIIARSA
jgi:hypothetical protein